jgi:hypothetical protein
MLTAISVYETCAELFASYPLAAEPLDGAGRAHSMVLMTRDQEAASFWLLARVHRDDVAPAYSLYSWSSGVGLVIDSTSIPVTEPARNALTQGVPLPRHGSLFGWVERGNVSALVGFDTTYEPAGPPPRWSVMPRMETPPALWPPFTREMLFGPWFWEYYEAGALVSLDRLIFKNPRTVFWVSTTASIGSDCCAVARKIKRGKRYALKRGRYVASEVLCAGKKVPPLRTLLADERKVDVSPRFRRYASKKVR